MKQRIGESRADYLERERVAARVKYARLTSEQRRERNLRSAERWRERYREDAGFRQRERQRTHDRYRQLSPEARRLWSPSHRMSPESRLRKKERDKSGSRRRYQRRLANPHARKWRDWYEENLEHRRAWRAHWYDLQFARGIDHPAYRETVLLWRRLVRELKSR